MANFLGVAPVKGLASTMMAKTNRKVMVKTNILTNFGSQFYIHSDAYLDMLQQHTTAISKV